MTLKRERKNVKIATKMLKRHKSVQIYNKKRDTFVNKQNCAFEHLHTSFAQVREKMCKTC